MRQQATGEFVQVEYTLKERRGCLPEGKKVCLVVRRVRRVEECGQTEVETSRSQIQKGDDYIVSLGFGDGLQLA